MGPASNGYTTLRVLRREKNIVEVITSDERIRDALPACDADGVFAPAT
jgi:hypothetical protein